MALLEVRRITKFFGGLAALTDVNLEIKEGEIVGLIGPNGAGKTTLFNLITGYYHPTKGEVIFRGENATGKSPDQMAKRGIIRSFQAAILFKRHTVIESMIVAHHLRARPGIWAWAFNTPFSRKTERRLYESSMEIMEFMELLPFKDKIVATLSHGNQRALSIAMALAANPKMLLLDEPVTGMNPERASHLMGLIKKIREQGTTVMIIEHNTRAIFSICDRIAVLDSGAKIAEGSSPEIVGNKKVIAAYLGGGVVT